jgi:hypothetical protein
MACQSLMFQKDGSASGAVAALLDDETSNVRHTAVRTLGWLGARDNLPDIRRLYRRETAAGTASWMFPDCFARLGDDELAIRSARPHLASENWNVRYFVVEALARVESKQVVPVLMSALPLEMVLELEFQPYFVPERTFLKICEVLDRRTGTEFGADAAARLRWWRENSAEYGVAAEDARLPEGFDELSRRFTEAARFAEAAAKRAAPREARGGSYCNLRITYGPVEAGERDEREAWSEPVNGLRARLFARPRYRTGENVQVLLMLECVGEEAAKIPGAVVDSYVPYVGADGPDVRILRDLQLVRTAAEQLSAGGMRMHAIDISAGRQLVERVEVLRILDAPARHSAVFVAPPRPGKYHFRAVFSPCGVAPDGIGDDSHARDYPEWKSKQLVTPPIVIEIVEQE